MRLLLVEDDVDLSSALAQGFHEEGFAVDQAFTGPEGLHCARTREYDVAILDLMLPGFDGHQLLRALREEENRLPVVILSARASVSDRILGLKGGADDYVAKPFSFEELLARVRALLRRAAGLAESTLRWGNLILDPGGHTASWNGYALPLTPKEFCLLEALLLHQGKVLNRQRLLLKVYDGDAGRGSNVLDAHLSNLRRKLVEATGQPIVETIRGTGFRIPRDRP